MGTMAGDIDKAFRELSEDERFRDGGLARRREVVDGVLVYEIRVSELELDDELLGRLQEIAAAEDLDLEESEAALRQRGGTP
jgi:hypothetical protein